MMADSKVIEGNERRGIGRGERGRKEEGRLMEGWEKEDERGKQRGSEKEGIGE